MLDLERLLMTLQDAKVGRRVTCVLWVVGVAFSLISAAPQVLAQDKSADAPAGVSKSDERSYQTIYLSSATQQHDANDIQTDLRNMLPKASIYYVPTQSALSIKGSAEDLQLAHKIITDLDRPKQSYRLTYTITEMEGGKKTGEQHVSVVVLVGGRTTLKQGNRVPIVTGTMESTNSAQNTQVQYVDVGLNIEATLDGYLDGLRLWTKIEQSSQGPDKPGFGAQDPVIQQTTLEATSALGQGKPVVLGSLDLPGGTRREEISVVSEVVR